MKLPRVLRKTLAYVFVPVSFSILVYGCILFMGKDVISTALAMSNLVIAKDTADTGDISDLSTFNREEAEQTAKENAQKQTQAVSDDGTEEETNSNETESLDYIPYSSVSYPINGTLMGCVICDRIGLDVDLYKSATDETLNMGVATENGSRMPGFGGTVVICGHRQLDFAALQYAEIGDEFTVMTSYETYVYRVTDIQIIQATDTELIGFDKDYENLVIFTCYPFADTVGKKTERYVLYCEYVSGLPVRE